MNSFYIAGVAPLAGEFWPHVGLRCRAHRRDEKRRSFLVVLHLEIHNLVRGTEDREESRMSIPSTMSWFKVADVHPWLSYTSRFSVKNTNSLKGRECRTAGSSHPSITFSDPHLISINLCRCKNKYITDEC